MIQNRPEDLIREMYNYLDYNATTAKDRLGC